MKNNFSKRLTSVVMATVLIFLMTACGNENVSTESNDMASASESVNTNSESSGAVKTELNLGVSNLLSKVLDPAKDSSGTGFARAGIGQSLMICNTEGVLEPWLAKSVSSDDNINWVVLLYDDVKFSNGNVCDAAAVMNSLQYLMDNNDKIYNRCRMNLQNL